MDQRTFNKFRELIYAKTGISLGPHKEALVSMRISKRMRALNIASHREYLNHLLDDPTGEEEVHLVDVISTHVTSFFREPEHFEFVDKTVTKWILAGQRKFRFWCAACSTGEEPYSLAITLNEICGRAGVDFKILATDISQQVIEKSIEGRYSAKKLENVPLELRRRYFIREKIGDETHYTVKPEARKLVVFRQINLAEPPFPMRGPLDIVFCRNVMIYFDNNVRNYLLGEIHRLVKSGGHLIVGHAESLTGMLSPFRVIQPSIYYRG